MAGSLFNRGDGEGEDEVPPTETEGVRIIDPDEAERAVERGEAARRRGADTPRYGDRPQAPEGPSPSLRFPLPDAGDPNAVPRPRMAPPEPPRASAPPADAPPPPPPEEPPVISLGPPTGEVVLPHWTDPPTGEVPRVIVGEGDAVDDRWDATTVGPRWREEHEGWDGDADDMSDLADDPAGGQGPRGALDTSDRLSHEEYLTFDDLDVPTGETPRVPRGSADDPIRIGSAGDRRPPGPGGPGGPVGPGERPRKRPAKRPAPRPGGRPPAGGPPDGPEEPMGRNVPQAAAVGLGIAVGALVLFALGPGWAMLIVEAAVVLAGMEYFNALRQSGYNPPTLLGLAAIAAMPWAAFARGEGAIPLVLFLLVAFGMLWYVVGVGGGHAVRNLGVTFLAVLHVGLLGSFAALLLKVGTVGGAVTTDQGVSFLLLAVVAAVAYDVGGFFLGRRFGRTPLSAVSPNKTLEGLLAGMGSAVVAVLFLRYFPLFDVTPLTFGQAFVFAVLCAVAAPVGDLSESLIKRDLGIKDMGSILPGHGGVFDRFDALLMVLPTAYYVVRVFYVG